MQNDTVDYARGETPMTDYQFKVCVELRNERDALAREVEELREEIARLKKEASKT